MENLTERLLSAATDVLYYAPFFGACGYAAGLAYGKFSGLPHFQVALNWAIYAVATGAISFLAQSVVENKNANILIQASVILASGTIFIEEMRRRELMGNKLMICLIIVHTLGMLHLFARLFAAPKTSIKNGEIVRTMP